MITIFTDGAARGNPGPGGWGAIVASEDIVEEFGGGAEHTTNNKMELTAVIEALASVPDEHVFVIYSDSAYVLNGITRWVYGWQKNNWMTSQKEEVMNRDLWEKLIELTKHKIIDWKLLKGHSGIPANERCDVIATSFADKKQIVLYKGARIRYGVSLSIENPNPTGNKAKAGNIRRRAYSYVSEVDGVIKIHRTWGECKKRIYGVPNAQFKKAISPADEEEIIKEFNNI